MGSIQETTNSNYSKPDKYTLKINKNDINLSMFLYTYAFDYKDNITYTEDEFNYILEYTDFEIPDLVEKFIDLGGDYSTLFNLYMLNISKETEKYIDGFLDDVAKQYGWGSNQMPPMLSARAAAKPIMPQDSDYIKNTKIQANALDNYYFKVWEKANNIKEDVINGKISLPSPQEVLNSLPVFDLSEYEKAVIYESYDDDDKDDDDDTTTGGI